MKSQLRRHFRIFLIKERQYTNTTLQRCGGTEASSGGKCNICSALSLSVKYSTFQYRYEVSVSIEKSSTVRRLCTAGMIRCCFVGSKKLYQSNRICMQVHLWLLCKPSAAGVSQGSIRVSTACACGRPLK